MREEGFDLSGQKPQSAFELFKAGLLFDHVVTVCSDFEMSDLSNFKIEVL
jgi:arsenate reductase